MRELLKTMKTILNQYDGTDESFVEGAYGGYGGCGGCGLFAGATAWMVYWCRLLKSCPILEPHIMVSLFYR
jgi:hypothetical protein